MRTFLFLSIFLLALQTHAQRELLSEASYKKNLPEITRLGRNLIQSTSDSTKLPAVCVLVGNAFYTARQIDSALHYQNRAAHLYERQGHISAAAYAYVTTSRFYFENLQLNEAALAAHKSLELYQSVSDFRNTVQSLIMLSRLNRGLQHEMEAVYYARKAVTLANVKNLEVEQADGWVALAKAHAFAKRADSALLYSKRSLLKFQQLKVPVGIGVAHGVMADSYFQLKEIHSARKHANQAELMLVKTGFENELPDVLMLKANIYRSLNQSDSAEYFYLKAATAARENYLFNKAMEAHQALFRLAYSTGEKEKALQHLVVYNQLRDSAYTLEKTRLVEQTRAQYSLREKQREIELLEANARARDAQLTQVRTFNWLLIVGFTLLALISYTVYVWIINRNKARFALERERLQKLRFSAVLTAEEAQREKISRELHDGVGQLVSIVRLGLSGEEATPTNQKSLSILDQAVDELRAISHNLMPQPLVKKGLFDALKSLAHNLEQTGLIIEFTCPDIELMVVAQQKISIYRIVQEITNNMLKYAEASKIELHIATIEKSIEIKIYDNGKGFDTNLISKSNGIGWDNIYTRLDVLGGTMKLESALGRGSKFYISIPVNLQVSA